MPKKSVKKECNNCDGNGSVKTGTITCDSCGGKGSVPGTFGDNVCGKCKGNGNIPILEQCPMCEGNGWYETLEEICDV